MKKKALFILLLVVCVGYSIPTGVFAVRDDYDDFRHNIRMSEDFYIDVNYEFDDLNENASYVLYDDPKYFYFQSQYDNANNKVFFYENSNRSFNNYSSLYTDLSEMKYFDTNDFSNVLSRYPDYKLNTYTGYGGSHGTFWSSVKVVPMILENKNNSNDKKIVFATIHNSFHVDDTYWVDYVHDCYKSGYYEFSLLNKNYSNLLNNHNSDNINFMKNTSYNYSDELWNELNSSNIASSEVKDFVEEFYKTNDDKAIYSKYKSNVNYRFKVKNGNGMKFNLHDISNTFTFSSTYDKDSDAYLIVDNSSDTDYQDGIKEFSKIIIDEVRNDNFSELASKYKSITSDNCSSTNCNIYTYIPMILEGENNGEMVKQIVLGLMNIQYREDSGNDYYDISLNVYNNTCDLLNSNIDLDMSKLINLSRAIEEDYSNDLMDKYSNGSISLEDISKSEDINSLKDKYCEDVPVISLRKVSNPKTWNSGVIVLIMSMIIVVGITSFTFSKKKKL